MKDALDTATCLGHCCGIVNVRLDKVHRLEAAQIFVLSGDKVVDAADFLAARKQFRGDRSANKAGCASD